MKRGHGRSHAPLVRESRVMKVEAREQEYNRIRRILVSMTRKAATRCRSAGARAKCDWPMLSAGI